MVNDTDGVVTDSEQSSYSSPRFVGSPLFAIFVVVLVDIFGFTLILPLLPNYAKDFGASDVVVGFLSATFAVCQLVAGPLLGRISDRVGRKPTLIASQVGSLVGFMILGFANSLWLLFLSRVVDGATAGNISIAQAYISDVTQPHERTKAFGLIGIAFGAGFLVGPALSGYLSTFGHHYPAFAAALLSATSVVLSWRLLPRTGKRGARPTLGRVAQITHFFKRAEPRRRLLEFFLFVLAFSTITTGGIVLFLRERFGYGTEESGYVFAFSGLIGGIVQGGFLGRLVTRFGEERLATIGFCAMAVGYAVLGEAYGIPLLLGCVVVSAFGAAVTRPALTTLLTRSVGSDEQGAALGVSQSLASIAQTIGPILAGWLIHHDQLLLYGLSASLFALAGASFGLRRSSLVRAS